MNVDVKICGINSPEAMAAARDGGASYAGFIFYPPSPRYIRPETARELADVAGGALELVGVIVDLPDEEIQAIVETVPLDMLQLHGRETPERVQEVKERFRLPVMKSIPIAGADDPARAEDYFAVADRLLFDAKPPNDLKGALPGGNALAFDWRLLAGRRWPLAWMLSGGLTAGNIAEAVRTAGASVIDVSSGVEDRPGVKNPARIAELLDIARSLQPVA